ncbi:sugar ABC transporter permease [Lentzea sp. NEAU-D13]|uniref:Sugar ABC transporter permease n=1 Tax=Lentzea alba TaxID=2714351 RepID=A0A7C9W5N6_9PSEU|nr:sugar ABC transporter permease [Lentzea alba]
MQDSSAQVVRGPATTAPPPAVRRRTGPASRRNDTWVAWLLVAPAILGFGVFFAYPMLRGVYLSFTEFHILTPPVWTGLKNIQELINDIRFWHSLGVTAYFVVLTVILGVGISLLTAVVRMTCSPRWNACRRRYWPRTDGSLRSGVADTDQARARG